MVDEIIDIAKKKASKINSRLHYKVVAIGFDAKGELLGIKTNNFGKLIKEGHRGCGRHAERELLTRYKGKVKKILLLRFGISGRILPIKPCPTCQKILDKMGIKVLTRTT